MKFVSKVLSLSALALPSFLSAASNGQMLQVHVPFSFMVGAQQFAAGDYRVQQTDNGVLFVQGEGKAVAAITVPADLKAGSSSSLRFTNAEQHSYLTGVQVQGESARALVLPVQDQRKVTLTSAR